MMAELPISDRRYHLVLYPKVFTGTEAVSWMIKNAVASNESDAVMIGQMLESKGYDI